MPAADERRDPVHATLVAILQQLNRAESIHEGDAREQTLELREIERLLSDFWAIKHDQVKVPLALGLLVRNGLVEARAGDPLPARSRTLSPAAYRITTEGKKFLVDSAEQPDRIR
jgi:DNA-binding PadR family transcriptional regulator